MAAWATSADAVRVLIPDDWSTTVKNKLVFGLGAAAGYLLGTRAGRQQYERLREQAQDLWSSPKVQEQVEHAKQVAKEQVPVVRDKATEAPRTASEKVRSAGSDSSSGSGSGSGSASGGTSYTVGEGSGS